MFGLRAELGADSGSELRDYFPAIGAKTDAYFGAEFEAYRRRLWKNAKPISAPNRNRNRSHLNRVFPEMYMGFQYPRNRLPARSRNRLLLRPRSPPNSLAFRGRSPQYRHPNRPRYRRPSRPRSPKNRLPARPRNRRSFRTRNRLPFRARPLYSRQILATYRSESGRPGVGARCRISR